MGHCCAWALELQALPFCFSPVSWGGDPVGADSDCRGGKSGEHGTGEVLSVWSELTGQEAGATGSEGRGWLASRSQPDHNL